MTSTNIYKDISERTGGDIYIGVVGPVRTGKSTFIKKFCEMLILPNASADFSRERMTDELPQSSAGRTIMTTEPKFVPEKGARISLENNSEMNVRLVDCVGYIVPSSLGYIEGNEPRMVKTPWFDDEIPFNMAAEIGTKKVINEHSTIGLVVTTDGSISEIPRDEYEEAEARVIAELKEINKPFVVLLNCMFPQSTASQALGASLSEKYSVPVIPVNCLQLCEEEIRDILSAVLFEFPLKKITVNFPGWMCGLDKDCDIKRSLLEFVKDASANIEKLSELAGFSELLTSNARISSLVTESILFGNGTAVMSAELEDSLFYSVISSVTGIKTENATDLIASLKTLTEISKKYAHIEKALDEVNTAGYGIVMPAIDEMKLEEPEIVKHGSKYGVRLKASAPSIHLLRADIKTEVAPIVGSEKQSEELVKYLLDGFEEDPSKIWESNIFGKSLDDLVNEGLKAKLTHMPYDARQKLQQTLEKVINEGCSGLICIII